MGFVLYAVLPGGTRVALADIPGGTLPLASVPKFQTPLLIPPVMPKAGTIVARGGKNVDYYEISMRQISQQILPAGLPATTVWGYGAVAAASKRGLLLHNAPSLTIEARWDRPVRVKWINDLVDEHGNHLPHLLPVDPTLHWANPPGGEEGRDSRPSFDTTPAAYRGPVPMVTHVHGAVGVGDESDGYAEAWYLPAAGDIPAGYATEGTWYEFFAGKAAAGFGAEWGPGFATFQYPNDQRASTIWYHDHTLGMTRLNVYAGPAGFFLIRGGPDGDDAVLDSRSGTTAVLPGPAPKANDAFPPNKTYYEIPIAVQDRSFNDDGSLFYPDTREFFDGIVGDYIPVGDFSPIWNPEFFGNTLIANGNTWPFQVVEKRRYRLRFLNGCQSQVPHPRLQRHPRCRGLADRQRGRIPRRAGQPLGRPRWAAPDGAGGAGGPHRRLHTMCRWATSSSATSAPTSRSAAESPGVDFPVADPASTGQVLEFRVVAAGAPDPTTPPRFLVLPPITPLPPETLHRPLALIERMGMGLDASGEPVEGPVEALLGEVIDGVLVERLWMDPVSENPEVGTTEVWEFVNATATRTPCTCTRSRSRW